MGQIMVKLAEPLQQCGDSVVNMLSGRRKRKRSLDLETSTDDEKQNDLQSPKKKKLLTTTQYIYQALFMEQKNSDIAVMAMGKVWNLHKVYLCQSPYFYSMFNGSWKEACQDFVHIKILDDRITLEALDAVFGSMYSDEIEIDPKAVISVLATATLFHLDGIIDKCAEVMIETINAETSIDYYEAACQYGCMNVKKSTFVWLETNLLCVYPKYPNLLRHISIELMTALVSSADLYVMQTEFSLYTLLRTWIYLRMHPNYDPENPQLLEPATENDGDTTTTSSGANTSSSSVASTSTTATTFASLDVIQAYFVKRAAGGECSFLATPEGLQYMPAFQALRTQYLINHHNDLKIMLSDKILPKEWLHAHVLCHWNAILKVDHLPEEGPQSLDPEDFYAHCMRCGRILIEPGYHKWRWTGFNFGLDLVLIADSRVLSIRRHHRNEHERLLSLQTKRQFMIRVSVTSINSQRQPTFTQKSEITSLCLEKNEEIALIIMDPKLVHPLLISVNLLVIMPTSQAFKAHTLTSEESNAIPISEIGTRSVTPVNGGNSNTGDQNDSAVCMVPPTPPNVIPQLSPRSASTTSTLSTASMGSSVSQASSASSVDLL